MVPKLFLIANHLWVPYCHRLYHLVPGKLHLPNIIRSQKFGKPELTQTQHEQNDCEKL